MADTTKNTSSGSSEASLDVAAKPICGLVMPISAVDGYSEQHWLEVKRIIAEAVEPKGFNLRLVSDADESGIIQKRIVQNLYENEVVICDVSSKNPNVMFELGLRLAFDKPTIVIKDDTTNYSFDTSPIEHVGYPRDLRYSSIIQFKDRLSAKVEATYQAFKNDPEYSTFLKSFGEYRVPKLEKKDVTQDAYIIDALEELNQQMRLLRRDSRKSLLVPPRIRAQDAASSADFSALLKKHITEFLGDELGEFPIFVPLEQEQQLIEHLESQSEIRRLAGSPGKLKAALSGFVNPF